MEYYSNYWHRRNYQKHFQFRQCFVLIGGDFSIVTPEMFPYIDKIMPFRHISVH